MRALLMSGGMDSVSLAWWRRPDVAIFIDYGQLAAQAEFEAGAAACAAMGIRHETIRVDCSALGSGDMAGTPTSDIAPVPEWWPFRNQLLLTLAGMFGITLGVTSIEIGALRTDGEHIDGRPDFINRASELMVMQEGGITVVAPAIDLDAVELVKASDIPKEVLAWAHSCHTGNLACGQCRGCIKHYKTWEALGWDAH